MTESPYTRVTLVGARRRVDVVMPSAEPVGRLLPDALRLTDEPAAEEPRLRSLATLDGRVLDADRSLADAGVPDGAVLRVVGLAEAPPPPVVLDVTEEVADDHESRSWRWGARPRRWAATLVAVAAVVLAARLATAQFPPSGVAFLLVTGAGLLLVLGTLLAGYWARPPGTACILAGGALGGYTALVLAPSAGWRLAGVAMAASLTTLALGASTELGRGGVAGGSLGLGALAAWALAAQAFSPPGAAAVLAVLAVVLLGTLPRLALVLSGLTTLDDRRARDEVTARTEVTRAIAATHRGLALGTVAVAVSAAWSGWQLAGGGEQVAGGWQLLLAVLLAAVLAIRARSYPLVLEVAALVTATAVVVAALLAAWVRARPDAWGWSVLLLLALAAAAVFVTAASPPDHVRARARTVLERVELACVLAMVPVLLGTFGVYGRLLQSF